MRNATATSKTRVQRALRYQDDPRKLLDSLVPESSLQANTIACAHRYGYLAQHNFDSRKSGPDRGWPDAQFCGHGRFIVVEFKIEGEDLDIDQRRWRDQLLLAGIEYYHWYPHDWSSGAIEAVFARGLRGVFP